MLQDKYKKYLDSVGTTDEFIQRQKFIEDILALFETDTINLFQKDKDKLLKAIECDFIEIEEENAFLKSAVKAKDKINILKNIFKLWIKHPHLSFSELVLTIPFSNDYIVLNNIKGRI